MLLPADKPQWPPEQQGKFYGFITGVTNLTCEAAAEPAAEFTWMDKYNEVVDAGRVINEARRSVLEVGAVLGRVGDRSLFIIISHFI